MNKHLRLLAPLFALFTCAANAQTTKVNSVLDMNEFIQGLRPDSCRKREGVFS